MMTFKRRLTLAFAALAAAMTLAVPGHADAFRHLRLLKTEPARDATVEHAPAALVLFFSEAPEIKVTTIKVTGGNGTETKVGPVSARKDDATVVSAAFASAPAPGTYTVAWRTMSDDGHVVSGEYSFRIKAAQPE